MKTTQRKADIIFDDKKHEYYYDGKKLDGVTTVLRLVGIYPNIPITSKIIEAAQFGSDVHEQLDKAISLGIEPTIDWAITALPLVKEVTKDYKNILTECIVHNEVIATHIDLVGVNDDSILICDYKTTSVVNPKKVAWQLSIGAYLYCNYYNTDYSKCKGVIFHIRENVTAINVDLYPLKDVEDVIDCYKNGVKYRTAEPLDKELVNTLIELTLKKEAVDIAITEVKEEIQTQMELASVDKFECNDCVISYVKAGEKRSFDKAMFQKEHPEIDLSKYEKVVPTKSYIKLNK